MSIGETMLRACIKHGVSMDALTEISEIAARADAQIAELEQSVTVRDAEIARLETDLELARRDHASSLRLVADIRFALGDDGRRMQPELVEYCNELRRDWDRLDWLKERVSGKEFRRIGIVYGDPDEIRSKIDKARAGNGGEG